MSLPQPPSPRSNWAWFLDVDGTIVDIAPTPSAVKVPDGLVRTLTALRRSAGGALAVVSGRPVMQVRSLLEPLRPAAAGLHGLERVTPDGLLRTARIPLPPIGNIRRMLTDFANTHRGVMLENKGATLALHYRQAPEMQGECKRAIEQAVATNRGFTVMDGKFVYEVRPAGVDKGTAVREFMSEQPFSGRIPIYIGDDVTDEDAFGTVNALGGITVLVGEAENTNAKYALPDPSMVRHWLADAAENLVKLAS